MELGEGVLTTLLQPVRVGQPQGRVPVLASPSLIEQPLPLSYLLSDHSHHRLLLSSKPATPRVLSLTASPIIPSQPRGYGGRPSPGSSSGRPPIPLSMGASR